MSKSGKKEDYKCCGETFETKEQLEAHKRKMHKKTSYSCCCCGEEHE